MKNIGYLILLLFFTLQTEAFSQDKYVVKVRPQKAKGWGYIDLTGKVLIKPEHDRLYDISESGLAIIDDGLYKIINLQGEIVKVQLDKKIYPKAIFGHGIRGFNNGFMPVQHRRSKWGYLNTEGKLVVPMEYHHVNAFNEGYAIAEKNNIFYIFNTKGESKQIEIDGIQSAKEFSEGLAPFRKGGKWGFLDRNGSIIISPEFKDVGGFQAGLSWVRNEEGRIGFIDKSGQWVIKPQFSYVKDFDEESGLARVKGDEGHYYVDKSGNIKKFNIVTDPEDFSEGLAKGRSGKNIGFYNNKGEWVISPRFNDARNFKNGYAAVKLGKYWGLINKKGEWVLKPVYIDMKDVLIVKV